MSDINPMNERRERLRKYLRIPRDQRLKVVEDNLVALVTELTKDEPRDIGVHLPLEGVLLDIVHALNVHSGASRVDSPEPGAEPVQSSPVIKVEQLEWNGGIPSS